MPSSNGHDIDGSDDCRPDASRMAAAPRRGFPVLSPEEKLIYRKWKRATVVIYGTVAIVLAAFSVAFGPADTSTRNETYSALAAPAVHKSYR